MRPAECVLGTLAVLGGVFVAMCLYEYGRWS